MYRREEVYGERIRREEAGCRRLRLDLFVQEVLPEHRGLELPHDFGPVER